MPPKVGEDDKNVLVIFTDCILVSCPEKIAFRLIPVNVSVLRLFCRFWLWGLSHPLFPISLILAYVEGTAVVELHGGDVSLANSVVVFTKRMHIVSRHFRRVDLQERENPARILTSEAHSAKSRHFYDPSPPLLSLTLHYKLNSKVWWCRLALPTTSAVLSISVRA